MSDDQWPPRKDEPGETPFRWHPLTVSAEVAVVEGTTVYRDPPRTYSNVWVIRLDADGRCAPLECLLEASGSWWGPGLQTLFSQFRTVCRRR